MALKHEKQMIFAEERKICSSFSQQSVLPVTALYWRFGARTPVWFNRFNFFIALFVTFYPIILLAKSAYEDSKASYEQLYVPEALYFDNDWWSDDISSREEQMKCILGRSELEKLGRDLLLLNMPSDDCRMGNEQIGWFSFHLLKLGFLCAHFH